MNKAELIEANRLLREKIELVQGSSIPFKVTLRVFYCADCGNPFVLNDDQFGRRFNKDKSFYCAAGHTNVFNKDSK
jgi:hypothetical protein